jgi:putative hemolysin
MSSVVTYSIAHSTVLNFPVKQPELVIAGEHYSARIARSREEIDAALRLRFAVFNIELGLGWAKSYMDGKDEDAFDAHCEHVLLIDRALNRVVGTCRLLTFIPTNTYPFASAVNFDLGALPGEVLNNGLEVGRICLAKSYRNKTCITQLWDFIVRYARQSGKEYLLGCCSLKSQDPLVGGQLFEWLLKLGHTHPSFRVLPRPGAKCLFYKMTVPSLRGKFPSDFQMFLKLGGKICGMPAIDRGFKTIEYFGLLNLKCGSSPPQNIS